VNRTPVTAAPIAGLAALAALLTTGCAGGSPAAGSTHHDTKATAAAAPAQVLPSAPDPAAIHVPTGAPATGAPAEPLPTGPTLKLSPPDLWRRTAAVMADQKSASLTLDFRDEDGRPVHAESSVASSGDCVGRITAGGGQAEVVHVGSTPYLKEDTAFGIWAAEHSGDPRLVPDRWLKNSPAQLGALDVEAMCSLSEAVGNVTADFDGLKQERGPLTVAGRQVVSLKQTGSGGSVTLYVAVSGPAVVVEAVQSGGTGITTTFRDFGTPVHAKAPAGAL